MAEVSRRTKKNSPKPGHSYWLCRRNSLRAQVKGNFNSSVDRKLSRNFNIFSRFLTTRQTVVFFLKMHKHWCR